MNSRDFLLAQKFEQKKTQFSYEWKFQIFVIQSNWFVTKFITNMSR